MLTHVIMSGTVQSQKTSISVNGVAMGWLKYNGTAPLFPRVQILSPKGYAVHDLLPSAGLPPPPPPPPPVCAMLTAVPI